MSRWRCCVWVPASPVQDAGTFDLVVNAYSEAEARDQALAELERRGFSRLWLAFAVMRVKRLE